MIERIERRLKEESGVAVVLVALAVCVLLGTAALTVDAGLLYVSRSRLQAATDAAALAAAADMPDQQEALETAEYYARLNGVNPGDVKYDFDVEFPKEDQVSITAKEKRGLLFARVLGLDETVVAAKSVAAKERVYICHGGGDAFKYAIFAGNLDSDSEGIKMSGCNVTVVTGSVHTNSCAKISGANVTVNNGNYDASSKVTVQGSNVSITFDGQQVSPRESRRVVAMPEISMEEMEQNATIIYEGDWHPSGTVIDVDDEIIFVRGDVHLSGVTFNGRATIVATGQIKTSGVNYHSQDNAVALFAGTDIELCGTDAHIEGMYYAPHGTVYVSGTSQVINGCIVGDKVVFTGSNNHVTYDAVVERLGDTLPVVASERTRLIR